MKGRGHFPLKIFAEKLSAGKINMGLFYSLTKVEKIKDNDTVAHCCKNVKANFHVCLTTSEVVVVCLFN